MLLVTDVSQSLSFVSLMVSAVCMDDEGCGAHGRCVGGICTCSDGYNGIGVSILRLHPSIRDCGSGSRGPR